MPKLLNAEAETVEAPERPSLRIPGRGYDRDIEVILDQRKVLDGVFVDVLSRRLIDREDIKRLRHIRSLDEMARSWPVYALKYLRDIEDCTLFYRNGYHATPLGRALWLRLQRRIHRGRALEDILAAAIRKRAA